MQFQKGPFNQIPISFPFFFLCLPVCVYTCNLRYRKKKVKKTRNSMLLILRKKGPRFITFIQRKSTWRIPSSIPSSRLLLPSLPHCLCIFPMSWHTKFLTHYHRARQSGSWVESIGKIASKKSPFTQCICPNPRRIIFFNIPPVFRVKEM